MKYMSRRKNVIFLIFLVIAITIVNYYYIDEYLKKSFAEGRAEVFIERVIDGDTIVSNGTSIRLLGINTPERGEKYYEEAKSFLEARVLNKTVVLEFGKDKTDRYNRTLAYIILDGESINLKQVENGFANYYFPEGKDKHYEEFKTAWLSCVVNEKNLCEKSTNKCAECVTIRQLGVKEQEIILENECDMYCNLNKWTLKDEGRKNLIVPYFIIYPVDEVTVVVGNGTTKGKTIYWTGETYVLTNSGDTIFLRDEQGKLVDWKGY